MRIFVQNILMVGSINSIFYFLHKTAEPFNCLEQEIKNGIDRTHHYFVCFCKYKHFIRLCNL